MKMGLTSEIALNEIQKLFDMCFHLNAKLDRQVYVLDIKFNCPKLQGYWHNISHKFPVIADSIQEFGSLRGELFYRGETPIENKNYDRISDIFYDFAMDMADMEKQCNLAIDKCIETNNKFYEDFLRDFGFKTLAPYTKQATVFYKMAKDYENSGSQYKINRDFPSFVINEFKDTLGIFGKGGD